MEHAIPIMLQHSRMGIEARIAKLGDFLREKFNTVGGVAEDDALVDLQFRKQGIETVDLLSFLHERIVLGDASQSEFVHQIDLVWISHMFLLHEMSATRIESESLCGNYLERFDNHGEGCAE